jgi:probable HAF family extracellular repeat protein
MRCLTFTGLLLLLVLHLVACRRTEIEDLGTLSNGTESLGLGINASGNVSGASWLSTNPHTGGVHAFRYVDGIGIIDVGALQPANISEGQGINSGGQIVGHSYSDGGDFVPHAIIASATLALTDLGTLGGSLSYAWDINDRVEVTGGAANRQEDVHAFIWTSAAGMRDIGTLGGRRSEGRSINENGQVAGESETGNAIRAFRFTQGVGMIDLGGLPGGGNSSGYGINDHGQVVGSAETGPILSPYLQLKSSLFGTHAFLWTEGLGMVDLGHLGGGFSQALAINNNGVVVGYGTLNNGAYRAFRWTQAQGMVDLNSVLPPRSGWVLLVAWDINDRGQITGEGLHNGTRRAFRLNPPELVKDPSKKSGM